MKKILYNRFSFLIIFLGIIIAFFFPVFFKGYIPFPGDLLLAQYQPWRSYSYNGIAAGGIPNKAQYFDSLRQLYPWRTFSLRTINSGIFPFWNPHNFSGAPFFANFQSAVLYPLNIFYFMFSQTTAWTILIILQPFLSMICMFALARQYKLSKIASIFSAASYAFCLYMTTFLEYNIMGHYMYLLPLAMLSVEWIIFRKKWAPLILTGTIAISGFAGHAQMYAGLTFYILLYSVIRTIQIRKNWKSSLTSWCHIAFFIITGVGMAGIQLLPGVELIKQSARSPHTSEYFYNNLLIRPFQLVLYFIPDFFGNPATKNYLVPFSYPSKALYIGMSALYLAVLSFFIYPKNQLWKAIVICTVAVALIVILNPISFIIYRLNLPILSTSSPSNFIFLISFGLCLLAGFSLDQLQKFRLRSLFLVLFCFWIIMGIAFVIARLTHTQIVSNNVIYSFIILFGITLIICLTKFGKKMNFTIGLLLIILSCGDLFYFFHKFNPFVQKLYIYPQTSVSEWFMKNAGINRFWGYGSGVVEANFPTQLGLYSPDGYDPLYPKHYGELIQTSVNGRIPKSFTDQTRSDAVIAGGFGQTDMVDNTYRLKLLSILGVKYILDKQENGSTTKTFPPAMFEKIKTVGDFNIFEYKKAAPRFFLTTSFRIYKTKDEFTRNLFDPSFDSTYSILLNEKPDIDISVPPQIKFATLVSYKSNSVIIKTHTDSRALLYLSDTYYPGWQAFVDNDPAKIYIANYAFRAVSVPTGFHKVEFRYAPRSVTYGLYLSILSMIITIGGWIFCSYSYYNKKT